MKIKFYFITVIFIILVLISGGCKSNTNSTKLRKQIYYESVKIGNQVWMKNNLNVDHYKNGDIIPEVKDEKEWYLKNGAWCYYDNDSSNGKKYGKLYNWYAINDPRGLAPEGWHIPTEEEFQRLIIAVKNDDNALKVIDYGKYKGTGTNTTGFSALLSGYRNHDYNGAPFTNLEGCTYFWGCTDYNQDQAYSMCLGSGDNGWFSEYRSYKYLGFSVRCIKDSL